MEMTTTVQPTQTQRTVVQHSITNLETVYKTITLKINEYKEKVSKIKSKGVSASLKENALAGVKKIQEDYNALKESRLFETRKIDSFVKLFTESEKHLDALREELQQFANACLKEEIRLTELKQAEDQIAKNKEIEMINFRAACRDYIRSQYAEIQKQYARDIRNVLDEHSLNETESDLVLKLKAIELSAIKNKIPEFKFIHNEKQSTEQLKQMYVGVYSELENERTEAKNVQSIYLQDSIKLIPSLRKQLSVDIEKAKQSIEAKHTIQTASIEVAHEEKVSDDKLSDTLTMVDSFVPEVVIASKKIITGKIVSHVGGLSLAKWYFKQDEYINKSVDKLETVSLGSMLTLAKKEYSKDSDFELNGIEFTSDVAAK